MDQFKTWLDLVSSRLDNYPLTATLIGIVVLAAIAFIADLIAKRQLVRLLRGLARRTRSTWDDALISEQVFGRFAKIVPAVIVMFGAKGIPGLPDGSVQVVENVAMAYMALTIMLALGALMNAANKIYEQYPIAKDRPVKGYIQVAKIILYCIGAILAISALLDRSPLLLLSGFGAMTAVLMLVFRDTILSLVASIQLIGNDMVRVGDWIEMPASNADGDVIDVALHTVKVQNWDKTITTIFDSAGVLENLQKFVSDNAKRIYGVNPPKKEVVLEKREFEVPKSYGEVVPMFAGEKLKWSVESVL